MRNLEEQRPMIIDRMEDRICRWLRHRCLRRSMERPILSKFFREVPPKYMWHKQLSHVELGDLVLVNRSRHVENRNSLGKKGTKKETRD